MVLVKAVPNPSKTHGETICCAGVTLAREWRRLFPVRFRHLGGDQQFRRWQWVSYRYGPSRDDLRRESRRVHEESLAAEEVMPERERAGFLDRLVVAGVAKATERGDSLALLRPRSTRFYHLKRSPKDVEEERLAFEKSGRQESFLDRELAAYVPPPYEFRMKVTDAGGNHDYGCGDWETTAAFFNLRRSHGEAEALRHLDHQYNDVRTQRGLVLAMGTMKKRPKQWLLLGLLTLPKVAQSGLDV